MKMHHFNDFKWFRLRQFHIVPAEGDKGQQFFDRNRFSIIENLSSFMLLWPFSGCFLSHLLLHIFNIFWSASVECLIISANCTEAFSPSFLKAHGTETFLLSLDYMSVPFWLYMSDVLLWHLLPSAGSPSAQTTLTLVILHWRRLHLPVTAAWFS